MPVVLCDLLTSADQYHEVDEKCKQVTVSSFGRRCALEGVHESLQGGDHVGAEALGEQAQGAFAELGDLEALGKSADLGKGEGVEGT